MKRVEIMDVTSYCAQQRKTLITAKAKAYDLMRALKTLSESTPENMNAEMDRLCGLIDDIDSRVEILRTECPAEWEEEKLELDQRLDSTLNGLEKIAGQVNAVMPDSISWI